MPKIVYETENDYHISWSRGYWFKSLLPSHWVQKAQNSLIKEEKEKKKKEKAMMLTCLESYQGRLSELTSMLLFVLHLLHNI